MCRWLAYSGGPIAMDELLFNMEHSLIDQSMSARMAAHTTNGDGFGLGWYGRKGRSAVYRSIQPAWNDGNLRDLAFQIESPLFLAHVRRSTGTPVQTSNCHPFRYDNWLFVHNGVMRDFQSYKRDIMLAIAPEYFPLLRGNTDSELMFFLTLTLGLEAEPIRAVERLIEVIESLAAARGVENAIQMTLGIADGDRLYAFRYSTERNSRSLYHSQSIADVLELFPDETDPDRFPLDARAVVSEPLTDVAAEWVEVPESTALIVSGGNIEKIPLSVEAT